MATHGITDDTIELGAVLIDFPGLLDVGVDLDGGPVRAMWPAWAEALNADGGINGRSVNVTVEEFLPIGTETSLAACVALTEDREVFLAAGQLFGETPLCFTEDHETPYLSFYGSTAELDDRSVAPILATGMSAEPALQRAIEVFVEQGYGEGKKIGLQYPAPAADFMNEVVVPILEDADLDIAATSVAEDFGEDTAAATAAAEIEVERMREAAVDMLITPSEVFSLMAALQSNDFAPQVVFLNGQASNDGGFDGVDVDPSFLDDAIAITPNNPTSDELRADAGLEKCVEEYNASDPQEPLVFQDMSNGELLAAAQSCAAFRAFVQIAEAAGRDLTPASFLAAAKDFGEIELPGFVGSSYGPEKLWAENAMRVYEWDQDAHSMVPATDPILVED